MSEKAPAYICGKCGLAVLVVDGRFIRGCDHHSAVVVATMSAVATGEGSAEQK